MIEISHQQAQRLLRSRLDQQLSSEQWRMLQEHLETCESCRAYDTRLIGLEKSLRRSLRTGWENIHGPPENTDQDVFFIFQRLRRHRRWKILAAFAALLILIVILAVGSSGIWDRFSAANSGKIIETGTLRVGQIERMEFPTTAMQPTVEPGQFPDVIVYESRFSAARD